jgi:hypothetical protein
MTMKKLLVEIKILCHHLYNIKILCIIGQNNIPNVSSKIVGNLLRWGIMVGAKVWNS